MIYYFSGTGNSKWVAEKIAEKTGDTLVNVAGYINNNEVSITVRKEETAGFVFPVYAWAVPDFFMKFIRSIKIEEGAFCFAVCTCGDEAGLSMKKLAKEINLNSAYSIRMPNSYIIGYDVDTAQDTAKKIDAAKIKLEALSEDVISRKAVWDVFEGSNAFLKSSVASVMFNKFGKNTKPFSVDGTCISCGLCEKICPTHNINLKEGMPVWGDDCLMCLACINRCPEKSIQYGNSTRNKGRYYFKDQEG